MKLIKRNLIYILLSIVVAAMISNRMIKYLTPLYESTAKIKLEDKNIFKSLNISNDELSNGKILGEVEVLNSVKLINKAIENKHFDIIVNRIGKMINQELYDKSPFEIEIYLQDEKYFNKKFILEFVNDRKYILNNPITNSKTEGFFGQKLEQSGILFYVNLKPGLTIDKYFGNYSIEKLSQEKLMQNIKKDLDISAIEKEVPIIRINYKSPVSEKAQLMVNGLAEAYISDFIENNTMNADTSLKFLKSEIDTLTLKLTQAEYELKNFKQINGITNILQETETDLRKLAELKVQQVNVKMNLQAVSGLNKYIKNSINVLDKSSNFEQYSDLLSTEIVKNINQLETEKSELLIKYTPNDERVKGIDTKIANLTNYQKESINNSRKSLQEKYNVISKEINSTENKLSRTPEIDRMLTVLNRKFEIYKDAYTFLNQKKIESELNKNDKIVYHKIIDFGINSSNQIYPNKTYLISIAVLLGFLIPVFLLFILNNFYGKVFSDEDIENNTPFPFLFTLPNLFNQKKQNVLFKELAHNLEIKNLLVDKSILSFTSISDNKYQNQYIIKLANTLSLQGKNVMILDVVGNVGIRNLDSKIKILNISKGNLFDNSVKDIKLKLEELCQGFDLCLVNNTSFKNNFSTNILLDFCTANLIIVEYRKTYLNSIKNINLLIDKYKFENIFFTLSNNFSKKNILQKIFNLNF